MEKLSTVNQNNLQVFIFLGRPASGKGMQHELFAEILKSADKKVKMFDMGTRLREISKDLDHPFSQKMKRLTSQGKSVPLEMICDVWREFFNNLPEGVTHVVLAGTIRLVPEVDIFLREILPRASKIFVLEIDVPEQVCRERIERRYLSEGRQDDADIIAVNERFRVFNQKTFPALDQFKVSCEKFPNLSYHKIDGHREPKRVLADIVFAITSKPRQITLHGDNGASKSTMAELIHLTTGLTPMSSGAFARKLARDSQVSIEEAAKTALSPNSKISDFDTAIDDWVRRQASADCFVMDTRMGFYFIPDSFKVRLQLPPRFAAEWIWGNPERRSKESARSLQELVTALEERLHHDRTRYQQLYGVDIVQKEHYDLVVDMTLFQGYPEDAARYVLDKFLLWLLR